MEWKLILPTSSLDGMEGGTRRRGRCWGRGRYWLNRGEESPDESMRIGYWRCSLEGNYTVEVIGM